MKSGKVLSDLKLEKYLLGELPADEMKLLQEREATDEIFRACVEFLRKQNQKIREEFSEERFDALLQERRNKPNHSNWMIKIAAMIVVAFGILSVIFIAKSERQIVPVSEIAGAEVAMLSDSDVRIKGMQSRIEVWKKSADTAVLLQNLDAVREGDELQLRYLVPQKCFGIFLSMDGRGVLTVHLGNGNSAVELEPGKMTTLPFAYKLDDAPHFEKFFLLTSAKSFAVNADDFDSILKQKEIQTVTFTVRKEAK